MFPSPLKATQAFPQLYISASFDFGRQTAWNGFFGSFPETIYVTSMNFNPSSLLQFFLAAEDSFAMVTLLQQKAFLFGQT